MEVKRTYNKGELARLAGVSYSTFYRWMVQHREEFNRMGVSVSAQTLHGEALTFVCREYNINLS